jgi:ABC-type glycerol-3-phosphate transport system permease component
MLSNDKNIERIADLVEEAKQWLLLKKEYTKLDVIEKVVRILSALTIAFVIALLALLALIYLSFAAAYCLAEMWNSLPLAFLAVCLVYVILSGVVLAKRHSWIERPMVRFLIGVFKDDAVDR